jgi:isopentenyl-diphosphate delta-isomerase
MKNDQKKEIPAHHRKDAHLDLAMAPLAQAAIANSFDRLQLTHCALPEIALSQVDITTDFLGYALSAPMFIGAMTGGTPRADAINAALAEVAQARKIALAVGSQRAGLQNGQSLRHMRRRAPDIPLIGNLGGVQLASA